MLTINYPDGSQLTSTELSQADFETAIQDVTAQCLGLLPDPLTIPVTLALNSNTFNIGIPLPIYAGQTVTGTGIPADTVVNSVDSNLNVVISNNATVSGQQNLTFEDPLVYSKVRVGWNKQGEPGPSIDSDTVSVIGKTLDTPFSRLRDSVWADGSNFTVTQTDVYTRTWRVTFIFYGPNASVNSKIVQSSLIKIPAIDSSLAANNLYVNPSIAEPEVFKELFQGQWWPRADLEAEFNEQITEVFTVGAVKSVPINIQDSNGNSVDFTVSTT